MKGMTWEEAAIKDDVIEYDIAFNIIYIMRTHVVVRYIGASSMEAWRFAKMQHTAERNGWTRFITMQPQYNLLYREEEREMLPLCEDQGVGVIPWSPMARGRLTRDWSVTSRRTQNDAFALKMYENAALLDKPVIDVVASIAEKHAVPRAHVAIAWLLSKTVITAPIIGATKPEHLSTAISALDFSLSDAEIIELEAQYLPHPVDGIIPPASGYAAFPHTAFSNPELLTPCPGPALPGLPDHSFPVTDVKRETVPARMRPIEKSSLHQVRSRC